MFLDKWLTGVSTIKTDLGLFFFQDVVQVRRHVRRDAEPGILGRLGYHELHCHRLYLRQISETTRNLDWVSRPEIPKTLSGTVVELEPEYRRSWHFLFKDNKICGSNTVKNTVKILCISAARLFKYSQSSRVEVLLGYTISDQNGYKVSSRLSLDHTSSRPWAWDYRPRLGQRDLVMWCHSRLSSW